MPESPAPGVAQAVLNYQGPSGDSRNVLHFIQAAGGAFSTPQLATLGAQVAAWWSANIRATIPSALTLESVILRNLEQPGSDAYDHAVGLAGTAPSTMLPMHVTIAMSLRSALGGRSGRGRIYHIGLRPGDVTGDNIAPTSLTALLTAYNLLRSLPHGSGTPEFRLVVLSRYTGGTQRGTAINNVVTAVTCDGIVDSQRRRLKGRGA